MRHYVRFGLAICLGLISQAIAAGQSSEVNLEAIDAVERAFAPAKSVAMELQSTHFHSGGIHKEEVQVGSLTATVLRDGSHWSIVGDRSATIFQQGKSRDLCSQLEYLVGRLVHR